MLLDATKITKNFGGLRALDSVDIGINENEILCLIGPNGSGKTTFFNVVSGLLPESSGKVIFRGRDITKLPAWTITSLGIARTFQNIRLFKGLTVLENILAARHSRTSSGMVDALLSSKRQRAEGENNLGVVRDVLEFVGIMGKERNLAGSLPYGVQRRLEIARALASEPSLLLLDEPAAGMNPSEVDSLLDLIKRIRDRGVTVFLIEHQMRLAMKVAERIVVFDYGVKIAEGTPAEIQSNDKVIEAYLGKEDEDAAG